MLEAIKHYFQDWSDACEYANECAPDLSFLGNGEPFTALLTVAAVCYLAWAVNEARLQRRNAARRVVATTAPAVGDLKSVVEKAKPVPSTQKLAA